MPVIGLAAAAASAEPVPGLGSTMPAPRDIGRPARDALEARPAGAAPTAGAATTPPMAPPAVGGGMPPTAAMPPEPGVIGRGGAATAPPCSAMPDAATPEEREGVLGRSIARPRPRPT